MTELDQITCRRATPADYPGITTLQHSNLIGTLTTSEAENGFLSIEFSESQFDEMNRDLGVVVAEQNGEIVGYMCGVSTVYGHQFQILRAMTEMFEHISIASTELTRDNTFIYGPVCITDAFRGNGVLSCLFEALKEIAKHNYQFCILFIADANKRSLHAHMRKLGMIEIESFMVKGKPYHMLGVQIR